MMNRMGGVVVSLLLLGFVSLSAGDAHRDDGQPGDSPIVLPGTQPRENDLEFAKVQQCLMCHSGTANGDADPFFSWQGGLMSQSARDPVYRAALAIADQDAPGIGEFCWRCHAPRGWLQGRATPVDGSALNAEDMHGISCDLCHRLVDPLSEEAAGLAKSIPPGYGNAMLVTDPANVVRGPYGDGAGAMPHQTMKSDYHASSKLCGACHNVSHPLLAADVNTQPPHAFGHLDRTYSEWFLSDFPKLGREGSCQACHYPAVDGGGQPSRFGGQRRDHFVVHGPPGGSTWVQDAIARIWSNDRGVNPQALQAGKQRSRELLKTAARLDLESSSVGTIMVRVTNLTGHKLPTGFAEGRRMWINVRFLDVDGGVIEEHGKYGTTDETLFDKAVSVPTLLDPDRTRVYEIVGGLSEAQARMHGRKPGESFHLVLNDTILKDNRIPPRGFENATFADHLCAPVGVTYADGQHWDDMEFEVPDGAVHVEVRLMFQSVSWEYIKFLAEENRTDEWGRNLYDAWEQTGQCPPEVIASISHEIPSLP